MAIWEEMLRRDGKDLFALVELAKWCEHRRHDFSRALALTIHACACANRLSPEEYTDLARRKERLERIRQGNRSSQAGKYRSDDKSG